MSTGHRVYSDLFDIADFVQQTAVSQGKNLVIDSLREHFKKANEPAVSIEIPPEGISLRKLLFDIEKACYEKALNIAEGNMARAARLLGIEAAAFRKALRERFNDGHVS